MTNQEIFELMDRFDRSGVASIRLSNGSFSLEMSKSAPLSAAAGMPPPAIAQAAAPVVQASDQTICAPMAGVFYAASAPGAAPYVAAGESVKKGQTVCLMEAMKMISEIPAPCDCVITEILKENGKLAAFDEPLFRYQPC